jgi:acyl transferase domain-containing protein
MNAPDWPINLACHPPSPYTGFGTLRSFVAGRLSHHLGWTGPSQTIDTACSSAMVAVPQACRALQLGECNRAVAEGANLITNTALFHALCTGGFLNDEGACKTFDEKANGYCRGEAVGIVVLKPLKDALRDGDSVHGVLLATGNSQSINSTSITNPVLASQAALYRDVLARANVDPADISYVEAHGTGTRAGDPVSTCAYLF